MSVSNRNKIPMLGIIIWLLACLFFMYEFFLRTFIGSIAQQVIPDLSLNPETFALLGSAYYIAYAIMQIPVGILADKFGVRAVMTFALLVCGGATYLFAHSMGFSSAFIARILMGIGSAFAFVCLLVIALTWFPRRLFGLFAGISQFIGTMGPLLGGGPLIEMMAHYHESWRVAMSEMAYVGVILSIFVFCIVRNKPRDGAQQLIFLDRPSALKRRLWLLVKNKQAWVIACFSATVYASIALMGAIWGTEYLQVKGLTQEHAAFVISAAWFGYAIGCPALGFISDVSKRRKPVLLFSALLGLIATTSFVYVTYAPSSWMYPFLFFCLGVAASGQNVGFAAIAEQVSRSTRATAIGLNNGMIILLSAIVPPVISYFIYKSSGGSQHLHVSNFTGAMTIMPILYLVALIVGIFGIKETFCKPQKDLIVLQLH